MQRLHDGSGLPGAEGDSPGSERARGPADPLEGEPSSSRRPPRPQPRRPREAWRPQRSGAAPRGQAYRSSSQGLGAHRRCGGPRETSTGSLGPASLTGKSTCDRTPPEEGSSSRGHRVPLPYRRVESYHVGGTGKSRTRRVTKAHRRVTSHEATDRATGKAIPEVATHDHGALPARTVGTGASVSVGSGLTDADG